MDWFLYDNGHVMKELLADNECSYWCVAAFFCMISFKWIFISRLPGLFLPAFDLKFVIVQHIWRVNPFQPSVAFHKETSHELR